MSQEDATTRDQPTIRLLVVDDHPVVRAGMVAVLGEEPGLVVVGVAGDGAEALALVPRLAPDVVLIDLRMPVMDGA
ncbi:MAG: response regulator transcription factor, partial [Dermatophilaceae bacterium]